MPNATVRSARPASLTVPGIAESHRSVSPPRETRRWLTLAVVLTAAFLGTLDFFIINLALPAMQSDLHATFAQVQLVIAAYGLAYAVCLITGGRLGDIFGRKRVFLVGVAGFTFASILCGVALSPVMLIASRILQGISGAMLFPQVLSIIQVTFPAHERSRAFGAYGVVQGAASFSGIVLGGFLVQADLFGLGWRPIFLVNLPVGLLTLAAGWRFIPESRSPAARRLDLGGVGIISVALFLLLYPLVEGREAGWPAWAFLSLAAAPLVLVIFVWYERRVLARGGSPLVEMVLFQNRTFVVGLNTSLAFCCGLSAFFLTVTLFLQEGLGFSPISASLVFVPFSIGYLIASGVAVGLSARLGSRIIQLGTAIMAATLTCLIAMAYVRGAGLHVLELMPVLLVYGIGQGLVLPSLIATTLSRIPPANAGSASGVMTTFQQVAFASGVAIIGSVFCGALGANATPDAHAGALGTALFCNVILLLAALVLSLRLPRELSGEAATLAVAEA